MVIDKIEIENLNKINSTSIKIAPRLTAVFSPNGTGKSSLAQALTTQRKRNKYDLSSLFQHNTKIKIFKGKNYSNELVLSSGGVNSLNNSKPTIQYKDQSSNFKPIIKLFSTNDFANDHLKHTSGGGLVNISVEKRFLDRIKGKFDVLTLLLKEFERYERLSLPSAKLLRCFGKSSQRMYELMKENINYFSQIRGTGVRSAPVSREPVDVEVIRDMEKNEFRKHLNKIRWDAMIKYCVGPETRYFMQIGFDESFFKKLLVDITLDYEKKKKNFDRNSKRNNSALKDIRSVIEKTHLKGKFILKENFSISNLDGKKIILSSGELKFLTFLYFIFTSNSSELIILDDPFSSFDNNFQDYIAAILKDRTENKNMQVLFLTHNSNALLHMAEYINPNTKTGINLYYSLLVDRKGISNFKKLETGSLVKNYLSYILDVGLPDSIRIMYSRIFLEHLIKTAGYNKIVQVIKDGNFSVFGKDIPVNLSFQKLINRWSHDDHNLLDAQYNISASRWVLNDVVKIIKNLEIQK